MLRALDRARHARQMLPREGLLIGPFEHLSRGDRDAPAEEGERLVRFAAGPGEAATLAFRHQSPTSP